MLKFFKRAKEKEEVVDLPKDLIQAIQMLGKYNIVDKHGKTLSVEQAFAQNPNFSLLNYHTSLGMFIRNEWKFWSYGSGVVRELAALSCLGHPDDLWGLLATVTKAYYRDSIRDIHSLRDIITEESIKYHTHWINIKKGTCSTVIKLDEKVDS